MAIGFDAGTYNLVTCKRNDKGDLVYKREVNAFLEMELENDFVFNMMKKAGVPLIHREDANKAYALGEAAIKMAYTMNQLVLKRPMKDGCVNPAEKDAFQIMSIMMHSLLDNITRDRELLYYSVPANAINAETDAEYHAKLLDAIFRAYKSDQGYSVDARPINEGMALVYAEMADKLFTGIGVSCLLPGTKIYTKRGILNIENVEQGDEVLTHKGRWRPVNQVITKQFTGQTTKLQLQGYVNNTELYQFVDNHELYVYKNGLWKWVGCEEIQEGDIVGEPVEKRDRSLSRPVMCLNEKTTNGETKKKTYEASGAIQRFIGYFLGDGSLSEEEGCFQFDFARSEKNNIEDVQSILAKTFGKDSTVVPHGDGCLRIKCFSKAIMNWLKNRCYDESKTKKYPFKLSQLTKGDCINLLAGLIRSDGDVFEDGISFYNTNTRLVMLVKQLFSKLGVAASVTFRGPRDGGVIDGRQITGKQDEWRINTGGSLGVNGLSEVIQNIQNHDRFPEKLFVEDGFCCGRVQSIENGEYNGIVYDLKVEEDHSFSGPFLTIHNCGAGMVNVAFSLFGAEVFSFSIVNSGDWIDRQAAKATGESIAFINREKHKIDLGKEPKTLVERAIKSQYELMIEKTVGGIKRGLTENKDKKARLDHPIDVIVAGGSASPPGFDPLFRSLLLNSGADIELGEVIRPNDPLYSVARGCLIAAENAGSKS